MTKVVVTQSGSSSETALVQALFKEKSGISFQPDCSVCLWAKVLFCACLSQKKNDELQKYPFGVSHSVQQEGSRKPLWALTFQSSLQKSQSSPPLGYTDRYCSLPPHLKGHLVTTNIRSSFSRKYLPGANSWGIWCQPFLCARRMKRGEGRGALHLPNGRGLIALNRFSSRCDPAGFLLFRCVTSPLW